MRSQSLQTADGETTARISREDTTVPLLMVLKFGDQLTMLRERLFHYLQGFVDPRWLFGISCINSIKRWVV